MPKHAICQVNINYFFIKLHIYFEKGLTYILAILTNVMYLLSSKMPTDYIALMIKAIAILN